MRYKKYLFIIVFLNILYAPYTFDDASLNPVVDLEHKQSNVMFTVGMNF